MTELIIYAIIVLLAVALSVYRMMTIGDEQPLAIHDEYWWMTLPM